MDWLELTVLTTTEGSELVSQILIDAGASGTVIEDKNDVALNQRPEGQWDIIDEEIARRYENLKMPEKHIPNGYLRLYAKVAASADEGAIIKA